MVEVGPSGGASATSSGHSSGSAASGTSPSLRTFFTRGSGVTGPERETLVVQYARRILERLKEGYDSNPPTYYEGLSLDTITLRGDEISLGKRTSYDGNLSQIKVANMRSLAMLIYEAYTGERVEGYDDLRELRRHLPEKLRKCVEKCGYATVDEVLEELDLSGQKSSKTRSNSKPSGSVKQHETSAYKTHGSTASSFSNSSFSSAEGVITALAKASAGCSTVETFAFGPAKSTPAKEISILLIGESGVGKSTLINMLWLCSRFSGLKAMDPLDIHWPIPVRFIFDNVEISTGRETETLGDSATQISQDYYFDYTLDGSPIRVCLIDTPGMGDTRGLEKDAENMRNIIKHLSHHKTLHGVCFLLKPNDFRFTVFLKYCIGELLKHFHKSILDNIVIGFIHTRGTLYKPGDTLLSLTRYFDDSGIAISLEKKILYCFDSEIVRLLAICSQNLNLITDEMCSASAGSWHKTRGELARMVRYIADRDPHDVQETVNFYVTLRVSEELVRELPELLVDLETAQQELEKLRDQLKSLSNDKQYLRGRVHVKEEFLKECDLDYPEIQCKTCGGVCFRLEYTTVKSYRALQPDEQARRESCWLDEIRGSSWSGYCQKCKLCWHSVSVHELVLTKKSLHSRLVEDKAVKKELEACRTNEEHVNIMLKESERRLASYKQAYDAAREALPICRQFLAENSVINPGQQLKNLQDRYKEMQNQARYANSDSVMGTQVREDIKYWESMISKSSQHSGPKISVKEVQRCIDDLRQTGPLGKIVSQIVSLGDDTSGHPSTHARN